MLCRCSQSSQHPITHISGVTPVASTSPARRAALTPLCGQPSFPATPHPPAQSPALAPALLWPRAEAVQLTEISRKLIIFQIPTWLPAQAQECQSQHKRGARTMWLGKEEEGGTSPMPVYISCQGTSSWYGAAGHLSKSLDKASVHTWPRKQGSALGLLHLNTACKHSLLRRRNVLTFLSLLKLLQLFFGKCWWHKGLQLCISRLGWRSPLSLPQLHSLTRRTPGRSTAGWPGTKKCHLALNHIATWLVMERLQPALLTGWEEKRWDHHSSLSLVLD